MFAELVLALKECHRRKDGKELRPVLHRDIKPGNVFLDARGRVKLGDFGLAKQLASQSKFAYTHVGTPFYMSPVRITQLAFLFGPGIEQVCAGNDQRDQVQREV